MTIRAGLLLAASAALAAQAAPVDVAGPQTTGFKPLDYFQAQCARCHGDYGSAYGAEFAKNLTDERLFEIVAEMAEGPAQSPLTDEQLAVETAFHRALRDGAPFLAAVSWKDGLLMGEATPGAKVWIEAAGKTIAATQKGHTWEATLPASTNWKTARLHAEKDGKSLTLPLAETAYSGTPAR